MPGGRLLQLDGVGRAGRHRVEVDIDVLRPSGQAEGHRREQPEHGARPTAHAGEEGPPHHRPRSLLLSSSPRSQQRRVSSVLRISSHKRVIYRYFCFSLSFSFFLTGDAKPNRGSLVEVRGPGRGRGVGGEERQLNNYFFFWFSVPTLFF